MNIPYRTKFTLEERQQKAQRFQETDPDKVMVIVEKHAKSNLPDLLNSKFLAQKNFKFGQIRCLINRKVRQRLGQNNKHQPCFLFINGVLPSQEQTMQSLYNKLKQKDGILYITYQEEESFYVSLFASLQKLKPIILRPLGSRLVALLLCILYFIEPIFWLNKHQLITLVCMLILNVFFYCYFEWAPYFMAGEISIFLVFLFLQLVKPNKVMRI